MNTYLIDWHIKSIDVKGQGIYDANSKEEAIDQYHKFYENSRFKPDIVLVKTFLENTMEDNGVSS